LLGTEEQRRTRDPQVRMARKTYRDKIEHNEPTRNAVICRRSNLVGIYCFAAANLFKIDVLNEGALNEIGEILL
jgi:formate/nitrite transporter FocA (FNT family)